MRLGVLFILLSGWLLNDALAGVRSVDPKKLESAKCCLERIRETQIYTQFGKPVEHQVKAEDLIRDHYPVLHVIHELSKHQLLSHEVMDVLRQISVPKDLVPLVIRAASSPGQLGHETNIEAALREKKDGTKWQLSDDAVREYVRRKKGDMSIDPRWIPSASDDVKVAYLRFAARAKELDPTATLDIKWVTELDSHWLMTPAGLEAQRRLARAYGWEMKVEPIDVPIEEPIVKAPVGSWRTGILNWASKPLKKSVGSAEPENSPKTVSSKPAEPGKIILKSPGTTSAGASNVSSSAFEPVRKVVAQFESLLTPGPLPTQSIEFAQALSQLKDTVEAAKLLGVESALTGAMSLIHQSSLKHVMSLEEADQLLGGVRAPKASPVVVDSQDDVAVGEVRFPKNSDPNRNRDRIPRTDSRKFIRTKTALENLEKVAQALLTGQPFNIIGETGSGKTEIIQELAAISENPLYKIPMSFYTEISDLIGRYVGGEKVFSEADLEAKSDVALAAIAAQFKLASDLPRKQIIEQILAIQRKAKWLDNVVIQALREQAWLLVDEINLGREGVSLRLNPLGDREKSIRVVEHRNEKIPVGKNFRAIATSNPDGETSGRGKRSDSTLSRWLPIWIREQTSADLVQIMEETFEGQIPPGLLGSLVATHETFANAARARVIGRSSGGVAYTPRDLKRVGRRFQRYRGLGLSDEDLLRREVEEVYQGPLDDPNDITWAQSILKQTLPASRRNFYDQLELTESEDTLTLGDVVLKKRQVLDRSLVPDSSAKIVESPRTKEALYKLAKSFDLGEPVLFQGERGAGKGVMLKYLAYRLGLPYVMHQSSEEMDNSQLVGGFDEQGKKDGPVLIAGRPEGEGGVLHVDEANVVPTSVFERLNEVLDSRSLTVTEHDGQRMDLHPDFFLAVAMNPASSKYPELYPWSKELRNRFQVIQLPEPTTKEEQLLLLEPQARENHVAPEVLEAIVDLHQWLVAASNPPPTSNLDVPEQWLRKEGIFAQRDIIPDPLDPRALSMRQLTTAVDMFAQLAKQFGPKDAYLRTIRTVYASTRSERNDHQVMKKAEQLTH